ncbi:MAG: dienelactone hydrolase family protein [Planctomycetales bacterium]|nr:dienelactone hydrolase family protein [Planctomycetales bacterium]
MPFRFGLVALAFAVGMVVAWGSTARVNAQDDQAWQEKYETLVYEAENGEKLNYRWYMPEVPEGTEVPIILFLHGAGERGDDNQRTLVHAAKDLVSPLVQERQACAVLIPQCPEGKRWVEVPWSDDQHETPSEPSGPMRLVVEVVKQYVENEPIDERRIYVTGLSMGGFGTWDLLARYPEYIAAAIPVCGGGDSREEVVKRFADTPIWVFHGGADNVVKPERSRAMVEALKAVGGEPKYTEYPGVGHDSWTQTYSNGDLYDWLFAQRLPE